MERDHIHYLTAKIYVVNNVNDFGKITKYAINYKPVNKSLVH